MSQGGKPTNMLGLILKKVHEFKPNKCNHSSEVDKYKTLDYFREGMQTTKHTGNKFESIQNS